MSTRHLNRNTPARSRLIAAVALLPLSVLAACGEDTATDSATDTSTDTAAESVAEAITVDGVWARTSPSSVTAGAAYMTITGGSEDDKLIGGSVDASIAGTVEIHEMVMAEGMSGDMGSEMSSDMGDDASGMEGEATGDDTASTTAAPAMEMRQIMELAIPAGEAVALEPGGYHVMLIDLPKPLELGEKFDLTLDFETAEDMVVEVEVKDAP